MISIEQLIRAAENLRNFTPKDEFDAPAKESSFTGRNFSIVVKPVKREQMLPGCKGYPTWAYHPSHGKYEVTFSSDIQIRNFSDANFSAVFPNDASTGKLGYLEFASFACKRFKSIYQASNAFGTTTTVKKIIDQVVAFSSQDLQHKHISGFRHFWSHEIEGDAARSLSESISIRISGVIGQWSNGQNILCGVKRLVEPSLNIPFDTSLDACIYKTDSFLLEVVDTRTNEVLYKR